MPLPHASSPDDQQLVRYLLGLLSEQEIEQLDELTIVNDEVAWRLRVVENDLVDSYLTGALTGETLERFETVYLASPRRRQKVEFAGNFLRAVDRTTAPAEPDAAKKSVTESVADMGPAPQPVSNSLERPGLRSRAAWMLSAAAALLLCASGGLLIRNIQVARELNESRRERTTLSQRVSDLEQQLKSQEAAHADTTSELEHVRASQPVAAQQPASARMPERAGALSTIAVALSPVTRSAGSLPTFTIPAGTDRVSFELRLEANEFPRYRVRLIDPASGSMVWRSVEIGAPSTSESQLISIVVPADILKAQHYSLELLGRRAGSDDEMAASYAFKAVR